MKNLCAALFAAMMLFPVAAVAKPVACKYTGPAGAPADQSEWHVFLLHKNSPVFQNYDVDCDGKLSADEVATYTGDEDAKVASALHSVERHAAEGHPIRVTPDGETVPVVIGKNDPEKDPCAPGWRYLLRDSFEDVSIFTCPKAAKDAKGAQFDWSRDKVSDNDVWSAKGVAALGYSVALDPPSDPFAPYVVGYAFAPSLSFNRVVNTLASQKSKNVDVLSFAATSELALGNVFGGTQYVRFRPALNTTFNGDPRSWSATAEWQPYWITDGISVSVPNGLGPFTWELDPIARLIYSEKLGDVSSPIFQDDDSSLRVGGVLALTVKPKQNDLLVPKWLQPASFFTTYEWLEDVDSGRDYSLLSLGLNFNLDEDGHTALKLNYSRGDIEETGQFVNQAKIGLAAKW
ncbi:exported hypothetical protein [Mesorhizobium plurifarium]|uniref:EF-hand domain-containing protein n=1 Tax=Mesorhizobium plurifarium TaxID=69974 RepID=A0A090FX47_MESPL|nr:exported hypothetical protein [Mesorhizobium plurifarium]